jgi:HEAT repeat protein
MTSLKYKKSLFFFTSIILIFLSTSVFAQKPISENAIKNLITGIASENEGLRKSSIYFAGKYEYIETVESLANQLVKEENPSIKILIANALFRIGDPNSMEMVLKVSIKDNNPKVKRITSAIYETFTIENSSELDSRLVQD